MSTVCQIKDVVDQVRWRLHLPASNSFLTDGDLVQAVNMSLERLSMLLQRLYTDQYYTEQVLLTVQPEIPFVSLPNEATDIQSIVWHKDDGTRVVIPSGDFELNRTRSTGWGETRTPNYQLLGNLINFDIVPANLHNIAVTYTTTESARINSLDDMVVLPLAPCKSWLVCELCILVREREQKSSDEFRVDKQQIEAEIIDAATHRDRSANYRVRDVR